MVYDIIGDIHGHGDRLIALLGKLGYKVSGGLFAHEDGDRKAIFVGDFVDRGPRIRETLATVREMTDRGNAYAVMGNHELNAICFHTRKPGEEHRWMRTRNDRHLGQHLETLYQFRNHGNLWDDYLKWFFSLPLFLDLPEIRVVHSAWDPESIRTIRRSAFQGNRLTPPLLIKGTTRGTSEFSAIQNLLKGIEIDIPSAGTIIDKDGFERREMRVRWWLDPKGKTFSDISLATSGSVIDEPLSPEASAVIPGYYDPKPVFFGHYWFCASKPSVLSPKAACLDYSVAQGGYLTAYTWQGESELNNDHFTVA